MRYATIILLAACLGACASSPGPIPQAPEVEIQEVNVEVPCIVQIDPVLAGDEPEYPPFDQNAPSDWAKAVRRATKLIVAGLRAENAALRFQIDEHNKLEPKCSD